MKRSANHIWSNARVIALVVCLALSADWSTRPSLAATPEGKRLATELLSSMNVTTLFEQMVPTVVQQVAKAFFPLNPGKESQVVAAFDEIIMPEFRKRMPEVIDQLASLYAHAFSVDELQQLTVFYATPLGRKVISSLPELQKAGFVVGAKWGETVAKEALTKHAETLRQRGLKL